MEICSPLLTFMNSGALQMFDKVEELKAVSDGKFSVSVWKC